jgi:hypothetical protein
MGIEDFGFWIADCGGGILDCGDSGTWRGASPRTRPFSGLRTAGRSRVHYFGAEMQGVGHKRVVAALDARQFHTLCYLPDAPVFAEALSRRARKCS